MSNYELVCSEERENEYENENKNEKGEGEGEGEEEEETLLDLIKRIRDLEDIINDMMDKIKPGEDHFCTQILECSFREMKESQELDRLNRLCNEIETMVNGSDEDEEENEDENKNKNKEQLASITQKDANDFQNLVFDLERCLLVLELFWLDANLVQIDKQSFGRSIYI